MATRKINGIEYPVPGIDTAIKILRPNAKYELFNTEFTDWECPDGSEPPSWEEVETELKREVEIYSNVLREIGSRLSIRFIPKSKLDNALLIESAEKFEKY